MKDLSRRQARTITTNSARAFEAKLPLQKKEACLEKAIQTSLIKRNNQEFDISLKSELFIVPTNTINI